MSADGSCELVWGGDERKFRLAIGELLALQEKLDCGPIAVFRRINAGEWRVEDLKEVLRLGLIGAGLEHGKARKLIDEKVTNLSLVNDARVSLAIMAASLFSSPDEKVGKKEAATEMDASPLSPSTEQAPS